jgi:CRISPR-associated exonuclease Cas4
LIEEPELYLHPQAERRRKHELQELSELPDAQVVLCTHSAFFIDLSEYKGVLRLHRQNRGVTQIQGWEGDELDPNDKKTLSTIYLFDPNRAAMLFADLVILVEDQCEKVAIPFLAESMNLDSRDVEVVDCGGNSSIPVYQRVLEGFGIK